MKILCQAIFKLLHYLFGIELQEEICFFVMILIRVLLIIIEKRKKRKVCEKVELL